MTILVTDQLEKRYGDDLVFSKVSVRVDWGDRIGLIGPNGSGKSTLMRIVAGEDDLFEGTVVRSQGLSSGYLLQEPPGTERRAVLDFLNFAHAEVHRLEERMEKLATDLAESHTATQHQELLQEYDSLQAELERRGGYDTERRTLETLQGLRIPKESWEEPVSSLSGGQRTRLHLGQLILTCPQLLLLDEPTNYLDVQSLPWLYSVLANWPGSVITISHEPVFMDKIVNRIWELNHYRLEQYRGNYSQYRAQKEARDERQAKEFKAQEEYIAKTEDFIRRFKAGSLSKQARGRETRLKRYLTTQAIEKPKNEKTLSLNFPAAGRSGEVVARFSELIVGYDRQSPIAKVQDLEIRRLERIALAGPNGTGKSTLLRTLLGQIQPLSGMLMLGANVRMGYFAQHQVVDDFAAMDASKSPFDLILDAKAMQDQEVRGHLGMFQLSGEDVFRPLGTLSGGQKSRLAFAMLALEKTNLLILDEPMSHFDSSAVLVEALLEYEGTILFVSHDSAVVDSLATQVWEITPQDNEQPAIVDTRRDPGRQDEDWTAGSEVDFNPDHFKARRSRRVGTRLLNRAPDKGRVHAKEREDRLVEEIDDIEGKMERIAEKLTAASAKGDAEAIRTLNKTHKYLQDQVDARWAELASSQD